MTTAQIEQTIQKFLIETTGDTTLKADSDLLASGLLDSLTMMDLVVFIEVELRQRVAMADMRPEQFRTIGSVAALVNRMQNGDASKAA